MPRLAAQVCAISDVRRYSGDHVVSRQRPSDPLQLELADWLDFDGVLDFRQHASTDEDLSRFGLVAEPRRKIGDLADGRVVETALEPMVPSVAKPCAMPMPNPISCPRRLQVAVKAPTALRTSRAVSTA